MADTLRVTKATDGIAEVVLTRPAKLNALALEQKISLRQAVERLNCDEGVGGILVMGDGRAFCAGSDIREMAAFDESRAHEMLSEEHKLLDSFLRSGVPIATVVQGYALGAGFQLAMCSDVCVALADAEFGMPELRFGAVNGNETALINYFGGLGLMRRLILQTRHISSDEALRWGLVSDVVSTLEEAKTTARGALLKMIAYPGDAFRRQKNLILEWLDLTYSESVQTSISKASAAWTSDQLTSAMKVALS